MMSFIYYLLYKAVLNNGQVVQDGLVIDSEEKIMDDEQVKNIRNQIGEYISAQTVLIQSITLLDVQKDKKSTGSTVPSTKSYYISFWGKGEEDVISDGLVVDTDDKIASEEQIVNIQDEIAENFQLNKVVLTAINYLGEQKHFKEVLSFDQRTSRIIIPENF